MRQLLSRLLLAGLGLTMSGCIAAENLARAARGLLPLEPSQATLLDRSPLIKTEAVRLAWRLGDIQMDPTWGGPTLVAANGTVVFLGWSTFPVVRAFALRETNPGRIAALAYSSLYGLPMELTSTVDSVLLGTDFGYVICLDPRTGDTRWATSLDWPSKIYGLSAADGRLFVETSKTPLIYMLDQVSGEVLPPQLPPSAYAWSPSQDIAIADGLYALSLSDNTRVWEAPIEGDVLNPPLISSTRIAVRGGERHGYAYLLDRQTGAMLVKSPLPVVTNLATDGVRFFGLTNDAVLRAWDLDTGDESQIASFGTLSIDPFDDPNAAYQIAVDASSGMLFVYLGDVAELFAFDLAITKP